MIQNNQKVTGLLLLVEFGLILSIIGNSNMLFAQDRGTTKMLSFSVKGTILPLTVINPKTGEYILAGTWNMDVNKGRVTNFTAYIQAELYGGSNPHSHQLMNFRQNANEEFKLDSNNSGEFKGTMDIGLNNNIVHSNVQTNIAIDRGVVMYITPNVTDLGMNPTIYGLIKS